MLMKNIYTICKYEIKLENILYILKNNVPHEYATKEKKRKIQHQPQSKTYKTYKKMNNKKNLLHFF